MKITRAGVDIAKSVFHVHAVDRHDTPQWQAKLKRSQWLDVLCERLRLVRRWVWRRVRVPIIGGENFRKGGVA